MFVFYDESILSYVSSIRDYFGLQSSYKPNQKFKELLNKEKPNKVFLILIDAMGANIVNKYLKEDDFLRKNMIYKAQTVFPSTTTAALTSIQNGKAPNENGWIAWTEYLKDIDDYIIPFQNKGYYNKKEFGKGFIEKRFPVNTTVDDLNNIGIKAKNIYPNFFDGTHTPYDEMCRRILDEDQNGDCKYAFVYFDGLDSIMHHNGVNCETSINLLKDINKQSEELSLKIKDDTMLVFVADHGQIDINEIIILKDTKFAKYIKGHSFIEPRALGLNINDGMQEEFEKEFINEFEDDYILLDKKQILETKLFGYNENCVNFESLLPDYICIGKTDKLLYSDEPPIHFKGHHTGITDDELYVPVIVYKKSRN